MTTTLHYASRRYALKGVLFIALGLALAGAALSWLATSSSAAGVLASAAAGPSGAGCSVPRFDPPATFPAGGNPDSVVMGDFNNDGNPDLAIADYISDSASILLGDGAGGFGAPIGHGAGSGPGESLWATST